MAQFLATSPKASPGSPLSPPLPLPSLPPPLRSTRWCSRSNLHRTELPRSHAPLSAQPKRRQASRFFLKRASRAIFPPHSRPVFAPPPHPSSVPSPPPENFCFQNTSRGLLFD